MTRGTFSVNFKSRLTILSVLKLMKAQELVGYEPGYLLKGCGLEERDRTKRDCSRFEMPVNLSNSQSS